MQFSYKNGLTAAFFLTAATAFSQTGSRAKIIDAVTKEPITGASIHCADTGCHCGCISSVQGEFQLTCTNCKSHAVTAVGYTTLSFANFPQSNVIEMSASVSALQGVVLTANRGEGAKRSEAPIAIGTISSKMLQETKPTMADQVLNKVSGVNVVNLGNEQHQMSIRQPMTTKSLFLYLEDGIPVRTSGLFNHNALLEMNLAAAKSIEVIKGPSSSLYGSEAIGGVVNVVTWNPTAVPVLKMTLQGNTIGYKRADLLSSVSIGKWGFVLSGYYAEKSNGVLEYSDFRKRTFTARVDYRFSKKTALTNSLSIMHYHSDMSGTIDSLMFARKSFTNLQTFTYRKVDALRYRSTLTHSWNESSKTTVSAIYRNNSIGQNPAYRVKDDYRKVDGRFVGKKDLAHGEINENGFQSVAMIAQHRQHLDWKKAVLISGVSVDLSPSSYSASYIRIKKDTASKKYVSYQSTDSILTDYATKLNNYAAFFNFECSPVNKLRVVASVRYDFFHYGFDNHLAPSAFSGSPDTLSRFSRLSPKIGVTYNFSGRTGLYANYSEGFVPPQVTELYTGVKVPGLRPAIFYNYEIGGWVELVKNKLSLDASAYRMEGTNEIISVKLDDGSFANQNAGRTLHQGMEAGLLATPVKNVSFRLSGAFSKHRFVDFVEKGVTYNGNEMANAPRWLYNTEIWYKPSFIKGFRVGAEWQHVGKYYTDPQNTATYNGYDALHLRAGYALHGFDIWIHVLNATNNYYSHITSKSSFGYSYQLADPRNVTVGVAYDFANLIKKKK